MSQDFSRLLKRYPELLRWRDLEKILGYSRRTIERRRAQGEMPGIVWVDPFKDGCLQATKASVIEFLEQAQAGTLESIARPSVLTGR